MLRINQEDVARYLGFAGHAVDQETIQEIAWAMEELEKVATPRRTYQLFQIEKKPEHIALEGTNFVLEGKDMQTLLANCHQCILMAVTLGQGVDTLIRRLEITQLSRSVAVDMCASSAVEEFCNDFDTELRQQWREKGLFFTDRFSPGYGDMPLSCQGPFCNLLSCQKLMGLTVTSNGLMVPRKSITAVIGISEEKQEGRLRGCGHCDLAPTCQYRKGGKTCGSK